MSTNPTHILTTHIFHATPAELWRAYSDPEILAKWWGPKGFTNTFEIFEFCEGGNWKFVMHGPDGTDFPNINIFGKIVKNERIEFEHILSPHFHSIITFEVLNEHETRVDSLMIFDNESIRNGVATYAIPANVELMERLENVLHQ